MLHDVLITEPAAVKLQDGCPQYLPLLQKSLNLYLYFPFISPTTFPPIPPVLLGLCILINVPYDTRRKYTPGCNQVHEAYLFID